MEFVETAARLVERGRAAYDEDEMLRLAAQSIVHRIGEAVARLDDGLVRAHPEVRWRLMKGMRNVVAHDYGAIDHVLVWDALERDLPREASEVARILRGE